MSIATQRPNTSRVFRITAVLVTFHSFLWVVGLIELFWWGPNAEQAFRYFYRKLPALTELVFILSRWVENHALYVGVFVFLVLVSDGLVYYQLRTSAPRLVSKLWSALMFFLPFAVIVGTMIGIMTPLLTWQGLSK